MGWHAAAAPPNMLNRARSILFNASCKLQIASCKLQVASCKLQIANRKLQVACCKFLQVNSLASCQQWVEQGTTSSARDFYLIFAIPYCFTLSIKYLLDMINNGNNLSLFKFEKWKIPYFRVLWIRKIVGGVNKALLGIVRHQNRYWFHREISILKYWLLTDIGW